jgi:allantoate deiminase
MIRKCSEPIVRLRFFFVPSHNGISHSPKEYTAAAHLESGVKFLIHYLYRLAY